MKKQISLIVAAALLTAVIACDNQPMVDLVVENADKGSRLADAAGTLVFQTNFDNSAVTATSDPQRPDITGTNVTGYAWTGTEFGNKFRLAYEAGNDTQRKAVITKDDGGSTNNILKYIISDVNVPLKSKARIQADLYDFVNTGTGQAYKEIYQSVRMKLHYSSFKKILDDNTVMEAGYYSGDWITLFEFWNNNDWTGNAYPFRISVGLKKLEPARDKFVLYADGQDVDPATTTWRHPPLWETSVTNAANAITLGTWMTVEIYFKEGTARNNDGKFWLAVTPDGGTRKVICDYATGTKHILTQHPTDPAPNGLSQWNPMKLYTSAAIINTVKGGQQTLQVYWDDYRLWKNKQPQ